jgi:peptidoglycan/LPS O-acetylase OafA/YrhL
MVAERVLPATRQGEIRSLTGLRLVAAAWVVAHHFWLFAPEHAWLRHLEPLRPLLQSGWLGVDLFFLLSGFVLAHNYVDVLGGRPGLRATAGFYWARLSRIWPTWIVVLTVVVLGLRVERLVGGPASSDAGTSGIDAMTLLQQVLLVQVWDQADYSATGPVGPGWSLSAEWLAYLLFPAVVLVLYRLRGLPPGVLGLLAVSAVVPFAYGCLAWGTHAWAWSWVLRLAGAFLAGTLVALFVRRIRTTAAVTRAATRVAVGAVALIVLILWWADGAGEGAGGAAVLCFPFLVAALALSDRGLARPLSGPVMVLGGRISFALYLVHMGVFATVWRLMDVVPALGGTSAAATLLQATAPLLAVAAAWVLWRYVEEPARHWMRRIGPRPAVAVHPGAAPVRELAGAATAAVGAAPVRHAA